MSEFKSTKDRLYKGEINDIIAYHINNELIKLKSNETFRSIVPGLTPKEYLCKYSGITAKRLETILTKGAKRRISLNELLRIAIVLQVPTDYLLFFDDELLSKLRKNK